MHQLFVPNSLQWGGGWGTRESWFGMLTNCVHIHLFVVARRERWRKGLPFSNCRSLFGRSEGISSSCQKWEARYDQVTLCWRSKILQAFLGHPQGQRITTIIVIKNFISCYITSDLRAGMWLHTYALHRVAVYVSSSIVWTSLNHDNYSVYKFLWCSRWCAVHNGNNNYYTIIILYM